MLKQHAYSLPKPLGLLAICLAVLFSFFFSQQASASTTSETPYLGNVYVDKIYKDLSAHQHYYWLYSCFKNVDIDKVTKGEVDSWDFFEGDDMNAALGTMYDTYKDDAVPGRRDCKNQSIVKSAFNYLGYTNSRETFCKISGATYNGKSGDENGCIAGAGGHDWDNNKSKSVVAQWLEDNVKKNKPALAGPHYYMRAYSSLVNGCDVRFPNNTLYDTSNVPGSEDGDKFAVPIIVKEGEVYVKKFILGVGIDGDTERIIVANTREASQISDRVTEKTCNALATEARDNVDAYLNVLKRTDTVIDPQDTRNDTTETIPETTSCAVEGVGWLVCPASTFMSLLTDQLFNFLETLLNIEARMFSTNNDSYRAWEAMRNLANVAFVIAFLIIIYSQITGAGLSNYGVKKMLPRIIVAAILVNASYWICAVAVDISNILGTSLQSLINSATNSVSEGSAFNADNALTGWGEFTAWVLGGGTAALAIGGLTLAALGSGGFLAALALLLPILVTVLFAFITVVLVLAGRQAIVIILIVISPLAFVAYLLPNTEQYFKQWQKLFTTMLLLFPIISVVFAGSQLAASVIRASTTSATVYLLSLAVQAVPLFITPLILKFSGGLLNRFGGIVNNPNKGPFDRLRKEAVGVKDRSSAQAKNAAMNSSSNRNPFKRYLQRNARRDAIQSGRESELKRETTQYVAENIRSDEAFKNAVAGGNRWSKAPTGAVSRVTGRATSAYFHALEEDIKAEKDTMGEILPTDNKSDYDGTTGLFAIMKNETLSMERRAAATQRIMEKGGDQHIEAALDYLGTNTGKDIGDIQQAVSDAVSKRRPFAVGNTDITALGAGKYSGSFKSKLLSRVATGNFGAQEAASMSEDEMAHLTDMMADPTSGMTAANIATIKKAYSDALADPQLASAFTADKKQKLLTNMGAGVASGKTQMKLS